jgi:hypothetical protein
MQTIDANGAKLDSLLFIAAFKAAVKLAPPRFLTLRLTPAKYEELLTAAKQPEVIQLGLTPGPLGKQIPRVNCVKPPHGIGAGIAIEQKEDAPPDKLQFLIHGIPELELINLG